MTEQKVVEILENHSYDVELMPRTSTILAGKNGCAAIVAVESGKTNTGWVFQVGKNTLSDVNDAIKFSKGNVIS
jgi:hypothetical protein